MILWCFKMKKHIKNLSLRFLLIFLLCVVLVFSVYAVQSSVINIPNVVGQNSVFKVKIYPTLNGIYKFAYIYDENDDLKKIFFFNCEDVCSEKKETEVFIDDSYLGNYYVAVFDYNLNDYVEENFEVVKRVGILTEKRVVYGAIIVSLLVVVFFIWKHFSSKKSNKRKR